MFRISVPRGCNAGRHHLGTATRGIENAWYRQKCNVSRLKFPAAVWPLAVCEMEEDSSSDSDVGRVPRHGGRSGHRKVYSSCPHCHLPGKDSRHVRACAASAAAARGVVAPGIGSDGLALLGFQGSPDVGDGVGLADWDTSEVGQSHVIDDPLGAPAGAGAGAGGGGSSRDPEPGPGPGGAPWARASRGRARTGSNGETGHCEGADDVVDVDGTNFQTEWGACATARRTSGRVRRAPQTYKFVGVDQQRDELDGVEYSSDEGAVDPAVLLASARRAVLQEGGKRVAAGAVAGQPPAKKGPGVEEHRASDGSMAAPVTGQPPPAVYLIPRYGRSHRRLVEEDGSSLAPGVLAAAGRPTASFRPSTWAEVAAASGGTNPSPFRAIDFVGLYSGLLKFFCNRLQASLGLATVHCSHSFLPWPHPPEVPSPAECTASTCIAVRQSGRFAGRSARSTCTTTGVQHVTSMELYALMMSYLMDLSRRDVRSLSTVLTRGRDVIDLGDTRDRVSSVFQSVFGTSCDVIRVRVSLAPAMKASYKGRELFVTLVIMDPMAAIFEFFMDLRWCVWLAACGLCTAHVAVCRTCARMPMCVHLVPYA